MSYSGDEALMLIRERIEKNEPIFKLILLDYSMPDKDGPQTVQEIRQLCEEKAVPAPYICCCTAYSEASFKRKAIDAGMNNFISKPIDQRQLKSLLKDTLEFC